MRLHFIISFLIVSFPISAQTLIGDLGPYANMRAKMEKDTVIDLSRVECIFNHIIVDSNLNQIRDYYEILLLGKNNTLYESYNSYRRDSLLSCYDKTRITYQILNEVTSLYPPNDGTWYIIRDIKNNNIEVHESSIDRYLYEEVQPHINWNYTDDTLSICGYLCHRATCSFRGRNWVVWFSKDIPLIYGPWKLMGLPGLILKAEDTEREHIISAISIRKGGSEIKRKFHEFEFKTTREKYNVIEKNYRLHPDTYLKNNGMTPKNLDGTSVIFSNHRMFFNPIEKE